MEAQLPTYMLWYGYTGTFDWVRRQVTLVTSSEFHEQVSRPCCSIHLRKVGKCSLESLDRHCMSVSWGPHE